MGVGEPFRTQETIEINSEPENAAAQPLPTRAVFRKAREHNQ